MDFASLRSHFRRIFKSYNVYTKGDKSFKLRRELSNFVSSSREHCDSLKEKDRIDSILGAYEHNLREKIIRPDDHQYQIVKLLQSLDNELRDYQPPKDSIWSRIFYNRSNIEKPKGIYLWGSVGCGKTFLMDLFYENCSVADEFKKRIHFHRFMLDVHAEIHQIKIGKIKLPQSYQKNPIPAVSKLISRRSWLLCLDEFQVTDVADAMILKQLFTSLFQDGVILVSTSNRCPDDLYKSGLQRSAFLPFIPLLKQECRVKCLDSNIDYRKRETKIKKVYFLTKGDSMEDVGVDSWFKVLAFAENSIVGPKTFIVNNRPVTLNKTCGAVADCQFSELCEQPLGADDYDKMGKLFHTVIIRNIPILTLKMKSEMRRFITFIDMMYDNRVRVIFSAEAPIGELFQVIESNENNDKDHGHDETLSVLDDLNLDAKEGKKLSFITGEDEIFACDRTVSRMIEMQTNQYWESVNAPAESA